jgi:Peptidase A4 family
MSRYRACVRPSLLLAFLVIVATTAAPAAQARPLGFAARSTVTPEVSSNWSGYAVIAPDVNPLAFSDVTGTWVEPKATCTAGRRDASAFWVGLGGYAHDSAALEQLGTAVECTGADKAPVHYAWWEVVPASSVRIPFTIGPGDRITAAVLVHGQTITFSLTDRVRRERFSKVIQTTQTLDVGSAEWIAEAPSSCDAAGRCRPVPLTNFGTVTFTRAAAIGNGHPGTIADGTWSASPIELVWGGASGLFGAVDTFGPGVGAVPGDVSADGRSFSVSWARNLAPSG